MKTLKRIVLPVAYKTLQFYWFVFRPNTKGVKALLWCEDNILLVRHSYGDAQWKIPGGGIKRNEEPEDAVHREVHEELSLTLKQPKKIGLYGHTTEYKKDTVHCFSGSVEVCDYTIDGVEIIAAEWFSVDQLPEDRHHQVDTILDMYKTQ